MMCGCAGLKEWYHNGFKVGPNYRPALAPVSAEWIDQEDSRIRAASPDPTVTAWWTVFQDPVLNGLIVHADRQNLDLKAAGTRILQARAQKNLITGELYPQTQQGLAAFAHLQLSRNLKIPLPGIINAWPMGVFASWEPDFWGRYRRAIESAGADLDAQADGYRDAQVLLLAETADSYVEIRVFQRRLRLARQNVELQRDSLELAETKFREGAVSELDVQQARATLTQTQSQIPTLETGLRQANNRLCLLLGIPPRDLLLSLGEQPIPTAPTTIAAGVPAELLRRRPDIHRAERAVAAQSAQIGVATSDLYPRFALFGFLGYSADNFKSLFAMKSFTGLIVPNFQWQILNYGRVRNNIRVQEAKFQEKVLLYQQTVLRAAQEVEDALIAFLKTQEQAQRLAESVKAAERSVELVMIQYREGSVDFNRVNNIQSLLVTQQDQLAVAQGNISLQMIRAYQALGGGWESFSACEPVVKVGH
jgi:NodT family efflux transporter outer membrane factor (OMF) lipoprotein